MEQPIQNPHLICVSFTERPFQNRVMFYSCLSFFPSFVFFFSAQGLLAMMFRGCGNGGIGWRQNLLGRGRGICVHFGLLGDVGSGKGGTGSKYRRLFFSRPMYVIPSFLISSFF